MQKYTLKELTEIGSKAALDLYGSGREAFTKAILDAIGYELPKDEEREAFDAWCEANSKLNTPGAFEIWKAGREELRKAINKPSYSMPPSYAGITLLGTKPNEPEWIPWSGGECPLSDKVKKWEYKQRWSSEPLRAGERPSLYDWSHSNSNEDIIAYRVWE